MLKYINAEPEDNIITFDEEEHKYYVNCEPARNVTSIINDISSKFDQEQVAIHVRRETKLMLKRGLMLDRFKQYITNDGLMSVDDIVRKWSEDGRRASELGTALHKRIENYYNQYDVPNEIDSSFSNFLDFNDSLPDYIVPYRTEFAVTNNDEDNLICGTVDMIYVDTRTNTYVLCDWKRVKAIDDKHYGKSFKRPMNHLSESKYNKYALQLSIYKRLFESQRGYSKYDEARSVTQLWLVNLLGDSFHFSDIKPINVDALVI